MAGSLNHVIDRDWNFSMDTIENLGDAHEALEECVMIIHELSGGSIDAVDAICEKLNFPTIHTYDEGGE